MKLVVDENISFAAEAFSAFGEVVLISGRKITGEVLKNTDALVIRSVTTVDEKLLGNSDLKFVGTATIGTDHVDTKLLTSKKIQFAYAAGCNADAVAEYVFTSIFSIAFRYKIKLDGLKLGVIGAGNIGSRVIKLGKVSGLNVSVNDPPLKRKTGLSVYKDFDELLDSDIITLHVPLNKSGIDKTFHLLNEKILSRLKDGCVIINTSRGEVIDNKALNDIVSRKKFLTVLDVWENEPGISTELFKKVNIGTPHIAGYSLEGKINGTKIIYDALCSLTGVSPYWLPPLPPVENSIIELNSKNYFEQSLNDIFRRVYDIESDHKNMSDAVLGQATDTQIQFDLLRKNYPLRREFDNYRIRMGFENPGLKKILNSFRFKFID